MMKKANCWKAMGCGREPGGSRAALHGVCPAATDQSSQGMNGGTNGGRICWAVAGTLCGGQVGGTFAEKRLTCLNCPFFKLVSIEEGLAFQFAKHDLESAAYDAALGRPKTSLD